VEELPHPIAFSWLWPAHSGYGCALMSPRPRRLLSAILKEWQSSTTTVHEYLANSALSPIEQLRHLLKLATSGDQRIPEGRIEHAVSHWATYNAEAARTLKSVHQERLEFTTALLKEMGADAPPQRLRFSTAISWATTDLQNTFLSNLLRKARQRLRYSGCARAGQGARRNGAELARSWRGAPQIADRSIGRQASEGRC
jgi:hypothetical protein